MFRYIMIENIRFIMIIIREKGFLLIHQKVFSYGIHSQKLMIFIRIGHYKLKNILIKMIQIMQRKHLQNVPYSMQKNIMVRHKKFYDKLVIHGPSMMQVLEQILLFILYHPKILNMVIILTPHQQMRLNIN